MTRTLDRFYPIVENAAWVERLTALGAKLIQLRMKDSSPDDGVRAEIRAARIACERAGAQLVVNDYWQLAIEEHATSCISAKAISTARISKPFALAASGSASAPTICGAGTRAALCSRTTSRSVRSIPTLLKKMPWAPQGLYRIAEWKQLIGDIPLVAIGGLTVERVPRRIRGRRRRRRGRYRHRPQVRIPTARTASGSRRQRGSVRRHVTDRYARQAIAS